MKVKWKGKTDFFVLTHDKTYDVISVEKGWYRIVDDSDEHYLYPSDLFEVIEPQCISNTSENGMGDIMTAEYLKDIIARCADDVYFSYNGKSAGISTEIADYIPTFTLWYGDDTIDLESVNDVMTCRFFDGKSLIELLDIVKIEIA